MTASKKTAGPLGGTLTRVMTASSDIALIVDANGIVCEMVVDDEGLAREIGSAWLGQPLLDTVTPESRGKVRAMLANQDDAVVRHEVNHTLADGDLPVRYAAMRLSPGGPVAVLGRDLRDIARLQQQLVDATLLAERDYALQRATEIQFRVLFQNASDAIVIADALTRRISNANPAAEDLLERPIHRLTGIDAVSLFAPQAAREVQEGFVTARALGHVAWQRLPLQSPGLPLAVAGWLIRSNASPQLLLRLSAADANGAASPSQPDAWASLRHVPEPVVVADADLGIVAANEHFLDLIGVASIDRLRGEQLGRFLGRHTVDLGTIATRTAETGLIRNFETVVRSIHDLTSEVDASVATFDRAGTRHYCVLLRPHEVGTPSSDNRPSIRAADEMVGLVGRKPLREIVRETADVIEELCIETALKMTADNRASAADMLGLSRQSLYAKLRRYGLGDLPGDDSE